MIYERRKVTHKMNDKSRQIVLFWWFCSALFIFVFEVFLHEWSNSSGQKSYRIFWSPSLFSPGREDIKNIGPCILEVTVGLWWKSLVLVSEMTYWKSRFPSPVLSALCPPKFPLNQFFANISQSMRPREKIVGKIENLDFHFFKLMDF